MSDIWARKASAHQQPQQHPSTHLHPLTLSSYSQPSTLSTMAEEQENIVRWRMPQDLTSAALVAPRLALTGSRKGNRHSAAKRQAASGLDDRGRQTQVSTGRAPTSQTALWRCSHRHQAAHKGCTASCASQPSRDTVQQQEWYPPCDRHGDEASCYEGTCYQNSNHHPSCAGPGTCDSPRGIQARSQARASSQSARYGQATARLGCCSCPATRRAGPPRRTRLC